METITLDFSLVGLCIELRIKIRSQFDMGYKMMSCSQDPGRSLVTETKIQDIGGLELI